MADRLLCTQLPICRQSYTSFDELGYRHLQRHHPLRRKLLRSGRTEAVRAANEERTVFGGVIEWAEEHSSIQI